MSSAGTFAHVTIKILEKEYNVACPLEEKASLLASAELLKAQGQDAELKNIVGLRIRAMREHLDSALGPAKQLTL